MLSGRTSRLAWIIAALGIAAAALVLFGAARAAILTALALSAPGVALTFALFPGGRLRLSERLLLTLGLSLGVVVVVVVALEQSSVLIDRTTVMLVLAEAVLLAVLVGILRLIRRPQVTDSPDVEPGRAGAGLRRIGAVELLVLLSAIALVAVTIGAARVPLTVEGVAGHTLLWILPDEESPQRLQIGVESQEFSSTDYRLLVSTEDGSVIHNHAIGLEPKEAWQGSISVPPDVRRVEATLYRDGVPGSYRRVHLVVGQDPADELSLSPCLELSVSQDVLIERLGEPVAELGLGLTPGLWLLLSDPESCQA